MKLSDLITESAPGKTKLSQVRGDEPPPQTAFENFMKPLKDIPKDIAADFNEGYRTIKETTDEEIRTKSVGGFSNDAKILGGALQQFFSPVTGTAKALIGDPLRANLPKNEAGEIAARTAEMGAGMVGPAAISKSLSLAAKSLPSYSSAVQKLLDEGVTLTPGQIAHRWAKGMLKSAEDSFRSMPVVGNFMASAQYKSIQDFNRAIINKALKPIGEQLPKGAELGPKAIEMAERSIGQKYEQLLPKLTFQVDKQYATELTSIAQGSAKTLPEAQRNQLNAIIGDVHSRLGQTGAMDGYTFKQVDAELNYLARTYARSQDPAQRLFADSVNDLRGAMRSALERANPKYAGDLQEINTSWAMFERVRGASIRRVKSNGVFSPADLLADIRSSSTRGAFARGDGLLQDIARAGDQVLPSTVPDSGTAGRILWADLLAGAGATGTLPPVAAKIGLGALPYTRPGMAAVNKAARAIPQAGRAITKGIEDTSSITGPAAVINNEIQKK